MHLRLTTSLLILLLVGLAACLPEATQPVTPTRQSIPTNRPLQSSPIPTVHSSEVQPTPTTVDLDLREANVVGVEFEDLGDGRVRFDVTLFHDDDGEAPSYADWWQIETEGGQVLGRRVLTHSHGTQPFTRSATIEIPTEVTVIIVRGHDMQHEFGGQIMRVDLETGETSVLPTTDG